MKTITDHSQQRDIAYTAAYWDYLRKASDKCPQAMDYGLPDDLAASIRAQCVMEFQKQLMALAKDKIP